MIVYVHKTMKSIHSLSDGVIMCNTATFLFAVVEDTDAGFVPALMTCVFPCLAKRRHDAEHYAMRSFSTQKRNSVRRRLEHVRRRVLSRVPTAYAYSVYVADGRGAA
jgi:hypothetical protein